MHSLRQRRREVLSPQTVLGTIFDQKLRFKLGIAPQFKVWSKSGSLTRVSTFAGIIQCRNLTKACTTTSLPQTRVLPLPNTIPTTKRRSPSMKSVRFLHLPLCSNDQCSHSDINPAGDRGVVGFDFTETKKIFAGTWTVPKTETTEGRRQRIRCDARHRFHRRGLRPEFRPPFLITGVYPPCWADCSSRSIGDGTFLHRAV